MEKKNLGIIILSILLIVSLCITGYYAKINKNVSQHLALNILTADLMSYSNTQDAYTDENVQNREMHASFIELRSMLVLDAISAYKKIYKDNLNVEIIVSDCRFLAETVLYAKDENKDIAWNLLKEVTGFLDLYYTYDNENAENNDIEYVKRLKKCDSETQKIMEQKDYASLHDEVKKIYRGI